MSYKNENKSHFILFFAGFFVPLRVLYVKKLSPLGWLN